MDERSYCVKKYDRDCDGCYYRCENYNSIGSTCCFLCCYVPVKFILCPFMCPIEYCCRVNFNSRTKCVIFENFEENDNCCHLC